MELESVDEIVFRVERDVRGDIDEVVADHKHPIKR
jgi:hypothetical protein